MDRLEAVGSPAPEIRAARLAAAEADPAAEVRLQRIANLATLAFSASRAAIALFEDGEVRVKAKVAPAGCDWPPASELTRWRGLREAVVSTDDQGFHAAAPLFAADGPVLGVIILDEPRPRAAAGRVRVQALTDLAALAAEEVTRKRDEAERETLVAELDHRVKNVLAAVQSLAAQSARKASSLDGFLKTFAGRLKSMASAHQLLTATRWRGAGMQNIAAAELGGLAPGQTRWHGPDLLLTPRAANAMSLALHELATNAVKFGALSTELGRVEVAWRVTGDGGLELLWTESGGPPVMPPLRRGFGATLLDKVTGRELGGEARIEHRREGVRATLVAGASALADRPPTSPAPPPIADEPSFAGASAGAPYVDPAGRIKGLRVLIVEDALLLALELEAGLSEAGAKVVGSAADVEEGLRMAELPLDAAVLDANLNGQSVLPVAQALAARGIPFIFATGYGDSKFAPQGFDAPLIKKPYDVTQVAAALAEITGRAAPREPITAA